VLKHSQILWLLWTAQSVTNEAALRANADISFATKSGHFNLLRTPYKASAELAAAVDLFHSEITR